MIHINGTKSVMRIKIRSAMKMLRKQTKMMMAIRGCLFSLTYKGLVKVNASQAQQSTFKKMYTQHYSVGWSKQSIFRIVKIAFGKNYKTMAKKFLGLSKTLLKLPKLPVVKALQAPKNPSLGKSMQLVSERVYRMNHCKTFLVILLEDIRWMMDRYFKSKCK